MHERQLIPITEARNPRSVDLDLMGTQEIFTLINSEDQKTAQAGAQQTPTSHWP